MEFKHHFVPAALNLINAQDNPIQLSEKFNPNQKGNHDMPLLWVDQSKQLSIESPPVSYNSSGELIQMNYIGAYAGIGARKTPQEVLDYMSDQACILQDKGLILRTGDADGADKAFRDATEHKLVYTPNQPIERWARYEVSLFCDTDYNQMNLYTQNLLARNMYQLFGSGARKDARQPSMFVLYWSPPSSQWGDGLHNNNHYN